MNYVRSTLVALLAAVVVGNIPSACGQDGEKHALPKSLTVKQILAIIGKAEVTGQGCGVCKWNGDDWGYYVNGYKAVKLPWASVSQRVRVGFAAGREPVEHHVIDFEGDGFSYRRSTDVNELTLQSKEEPK